MQALPDEIVVQILTALPYTEIATVVVRVSRKWHDLRSTEPFLAARQKIDERGLVVTGGGFFGLDGDVDDTSVPCHVLCGRWRERASLPHVFEGGSTSFRGELVLLGSAWRESAPGPTSPCCRVFTLESNMWRTLEWEGDDIWACCATDTTIIAFSETANGGRRSLRSLQPEDAEGWVSIPDPPVDVFSFHDNRSPSLCCVEDVLYIVGGLSDFGGPSDALQAFDLLTRSWTVRAPLPEPRCYSACVRLAGRLYITGGLGSRTHRRLEDGHRGASVFSYDPRTDMWRTESPLPIISGRADTSMMSAVAHEGRVVVIGIKCVPPLPPLALVDGVWTELPPFPSRPFSGGAAYTPQGAHVTSLYLG